MYTNPFSRTHSSVRQVIDRFLHIDTKKSSKRSEKMPRNDSYSSVCSTSSSESIKSYSSCRIPTNMRSVK